ncbi:TFIIE alpha subunit domain-containing protein [Ditylenchus destructor]|uniref:TFIIE alpha subunit domain-containing protein n=1 Tax=Ditylenchus destructor TaxID=166010 RepID=A0AAD4NFV8_9BILA|nr:TFIIE alpha subunit domain-containing protein [Ditylenchus destructor]
MASSGGTINGVESQQKITTEVPEILKKLMLYIVKAFYGRPEYVIADYIQKIGCVKEDRIRDLLKMDQKFLRACLVKLKVDKIIKERIVTEEGEGPRARKSMYYFINYKALLNVTKYKFDHMRTKLEGREKDDVHRSLYRCSNDNCKKTYEAMDIGKIYDPNTGDLRCWQCTHPVNADESAGPSEETRVSMAKFNEQMSGMFSIIQTLGDIRFSMEILEPPITELTKEEAPAEAGHKILRVGERAFQATGKTRSELYSGGITVSIGDEVERPTTSKEAVPWLQDIQHQKTTTSSSLLFNDPNVVMDFSPIATMDSYDTHVPSAANTEEGVSAKRPKHDDIAALLMEEEASAMTTTKKEEPSVPEEEDEETEAAADEEYVMVGRQKVYVGDVTDEMVAKMTSSEKDAYTKAMTNAYMDF